MKRILSNSASNRNGLTLPSYRAFNERKRQRADVCNTPLKKRRMQEEENMILMTWVRNDNGSLTAYPTNIHRARLMRLLQERLAENMQRIYGHEQTALFFYESLAAYAGDTTHRDIFSALVESQKRQLVRRAEMLQRLCVCIPCSRRTVWARVWQRFLLHLGPGFVLAFIRHTRRRDLHYQLRLSIMFRGLRSKKQRE